MPDLEAINLRDKGDGIEQQVVGGVIDRAGRVLVIRRALSDHMGGQWELPSGKVDPGEDLLTALRREILEETGLVVDRVAAYLGSFDYVSRGIRMRQHNWAVTVLRHEPVVLNPEEHDAYRWTAPDEAPGPISGDVQGLLDGLAGA